MNPVPHPLFYLFSFSFSSSSSSSSSFSSPFLHACHPLRRHHHYLQTRYCRNPFLSLPTRRHDFFPNPQLVYLYSLLFCPLFRRMGGRLLLPLMARSPFRWQTYFWRETYLPPRKFHSSCVLDYLVAQLEVWSVFHLLISLFHLSGVLLKIPFLVHCFLLGVDLQSPPGINLFGHLLQGQLD